MAAQKHSQTLVQLPPGLTQKEAWRRARKLKGVPDFRGFRYDSKTGKAVLT